MFPSLASVHESYSKVFVSEVGGLKGVIDECNGIVVANGFMASAVLLPGGKLSYKSKKSHSLDCVIYNQGKIF